MENPDSLVKMQIHSGVTSWYIIRHIKSFLSLFKVNVEQNKMGGRYSEKSYREGQK